MNPFPSRRILVIASLTPTTLFLACLMRLVGFSSIYFDVAPKLRRVRLVETLSRCGILQIDYTILVGFDIYGGMHWVERTATDIGRSIFSPTFVDAVAGEFLPLTERTRKTGILLHGALVDELRRFAEPYAVAEHLAAAGSYVRVLHRPTFLAGQLAACCRNGVRPFFGTGVRFVAELNARAVRAVIRHLRSRTVAAPSGALMQSTPSAVPAPPVLYFPHKGVNYGQIYQKDHFYSNDPDSPLHRSRILHLEWLPLMSDSERRTVRAEYEAAGVPFRFLDGVPSYGAGEFLRLRQRVKGSSAHLVAQFVAFQVLGRFRATHAAVQELRGAKLALVGYDQLFPRTLAVALQAIGARVVGTQERFLSALTKSHYLILDDYFVYGEVSRQAAAANPWSCIGRIHAVGDPRIDLLTHYQAIVPPQDNLVLVLDFHSVADPFQNAQNPVNNWKNNALFYRDILTLAGRFPSLHFVIRGKDDVWTGIPFFGGIREEIAARKNVEINRDYSEFNQSYRLAAAARVVIARYTALVDQCLAMGKPVLVHERLINTDRMAAWIHDYEPYPILAHSLEELCGRLKDVLDGRFMPEAQFADMRRRYYTLPEKGRVRDALLHTVSAMLRAPTALRSSGEQVALTQAVS